MDLKKYEVFKQLLLIMAYSIYYFYYKSMK